MKADRELYKIFFGRARTFCGGSSCQLKDTHTATDTRLKTTSGGSLLDTERRCANGGVRRAVLVTQDSTDRQEANVFFEHTLRRKGFATT